MKDIKLKIWVEMNGRIPSDKSKELNEKKIGQWCSDKRKRKRNGKISEYETKCLTQINGWYWIKKDPFFDGYNKLKEWVENNKRMPSQNTKINKIEQRIAYWCCDRRKNNALGKLSEPKKIMLEKIPGWFWSENQKKYSGSKTGIVK